MRKRFGTIQIEVYGEFIYLSNGTEEIEIHINDWIDICDYIVMNSDY